LPTFGHDEIIGSRTQGHDLGFQPVEVMAFARPVVFKQDDMVDSACLEIPRAGREPYSAPGGRALVELPVGTRSDDEHRNDAEHVQSLPVARAELA
jgi:hypothetical protein